MPDALSSRIPQAAPMYWVLLFTSCGLLLSSVLVKTTHE